MKKLLFVLLAGVSFATANAQFQFGVKAGANFSNLIYTQDYSASTDRTMFNFNAGVYARIHLISFLSFQPELYYSGEGSRYDESGNIGSTHLNYLNVPLLAKFTHRSGFYLETGPQVGFLLSAKDKYQGVTTDIMSTFNSAEFAWVFGLGFKVPLSPVGVDFRYNVGVSNIVNDPNYGSGSGQPSVRNGVFQLGLTYTLFDSKRR